MEQREAVCAKVCFCSSEICTAATRAHSISMIPSYTLPPLSGAQKTECWKRAWRLITMRYTSRNLCFSFSQYDPMPKRSTANMFTHIPANFLSLYSHRRNPLPDRGSVSTTRQRSSAPHTSDVASPMAMRESVQHCQTLASHFSGVRMVSSILEQNSRRYASTAPINTAIATRL